MALNRIAIGASRPPKSVSTPNPAEVGLIVRLWQSGANDLLRKTIT